MEYHRRFNHIGTYSLLAELRKEFWITHVFSLVKKTLKTCLICRRFNNRAVKLNQSGYREFRSDPPRIPYRSVFIDHLGPFNVRGVNGRSKVYLLLITCLYSRAVNLKVCSDLSCATFLRAFQLHTFEHGVPEFCISDSGSQIVAGSLMIKNFLNDDETKSYFQQCNVKPIEFYQYPRGRNELGGAVEILVKMVKRLLFGAIRNMVLDEKDFEFLICKTVHIINRRPVAFSEVLRDNDSKCALPNVITPETLMRGHELVSMNLIPDLQSYDEPPNWDENEDSVDSLRKNYTKLRNSLDKLNDIYYSEFLAKLAHQATNEKDRYKPVKNDVLNVGDIVLMIEPFSKPSQNKLGRIEELVFNDLGEATEAVIHKGSTGENYS